MYEQRNNECVDSFIQENITTTEQVYKYTQNILDKYGVEAIITGSDQVWRPMFNPDLKDLYLNFVRNKNIRRIAYAASFGSSEREYSEKNRRKCLNAVHRLDAISVREATGIILCQEYFGITAEQVLDPTLLLSSDDYKNLTYDIPVSEDKYLVAYILDSQPGINEILHKVCHLKSLDKVKLISENDKNLSPKDWLAIFRDASFVVTDSFHGSVFSIIFQKPYIPLCNYYRGSDRFYSLLNPLGMIDRLIERTEINRIEEVAELEIDWTQVEKILSRYREKSILFLKNHLS